MNSKIYLNKSINQQSQNCTSLLQCSSCINLKVPSQTYLSNQKRYSQWPSQKKLKKFYRAKAPIQNMLSAQQKTRSTNFDILSSKPIQQKYYQKLQNQVLFKINIKDDLYDYSLNRKRPKAFGPLNFSIKKYLSLSKHDQIEQKQLKVTSSTNNIENSSPSRVPSFIKLKNKSSKCLNQKAQPIITLQNFIILQKIGQTNQCKVFLVIQKMTNFILVMKVLNKEKIIGQNKIQRFIREVKIQTYLNHPNIIKLYGVFCYQNNLYILMQYGCDGNLYQFQQTNKFSQKGVSVIANQLVSACNSMHQEKIIHRDLKPQNVVLIFDTAKICDFGWAVFRGMHLRNTYCGTPLYISPQLMLGQYYDEKIDVWALGIMTYQLFVGSSPFNIKCRKDLQKIITEQINICQQMSECFVEFLHYCLKKNPTQRLDCQELLKLKFLS